MYILNKKDEIIKYIKEDINNFDELFISISFITKSGIDTLFDIKEFNQNVRVITTTEEFITEPKALKALLDKGVKVKLINKEDKKRSFHSKFIVARKGNKYFTMMGSMNLTLNSIKRKYETIVVDDNSKELLEQFYYLWQDGKTLTKEYIREYELRYVKFNSKMNLFKNELLSKVNFKANKMQEEVLEEISNLRDKGIDLALLHAATGTGKTYLSALDMQKRGFEKALFIVHSRTIINSAKRDYGFIFDDKTSIELKSSNKKLAKETDIVFTTQNTISKILDHDSEWLSQFDYFIFDEAHKIGPETIQYKILSKIKKLDKKFILAMSATPRRTKERNFVLEAFDYNVVGNIGLERAIEEGLVCDFKYVGVDVDVDFKQNLISDEELNHMTNLFLEKVDATKTWNGKKVKGIIFTKNTLEADRVRDLINQDKRYGAVSIHSNLNGDLEKDDKYTIIEYINRLQNDNIKDFNFIVTVDMFNEGVDIPSINTIGMFRFTQSSIIFTQQIGRGLRKEGSKDKYLNIIDLVGNHDNNYQRIAGLSGDVVVNPRKIMNRISGKEKFSGEFNLSEVSKEKILSNLGKIKFIKYFKDKLNTLVAYEKKDIKLWDLEELLGETIQTISNNFRKNRTMNPLDDSWIINLYSSIGIKYDIPRIDNHIIELFSWMPITASSPGEKELIYKMLDGKKVKLNKKWREYLYEKPNNNWRYVSGDFTKYFIEEDGYVDFKIDMLKNESTLKLLGDIKEYLRINLNRDDVKQRTWYSKFEIRFMAGYSERSIDVEYKVLDNDEKTNESFIANEIGFKYDNKVLNKSEYIVSTRTKKGYDTSRIYHNFIGKKTFHNNKMFMYVGEQREELEFNEYKSNKEKTKEYATYKFKSKDDLTDEELMYMNI